MYLRGGKRSQRMPSSLYTLDRGKKKKRRGMSDREKKKEGSKIASQRGLPPSSSIKGKKGKSTRSLRS